MTSVAVLFVGNLPAVANAQYVERILSAYGHVKQVKMFDDKNAYYANVTYGSVDDADSAIAALHCIYCTSKNLPLVVLYSRDSPSVTEYGRKVGVEYRAAINEGRIPCPVLLETFDNGFSRTEVPPPPSNKEIFEETSWNNNNHASQDGGQGF